ncbi:MAG: hypothetical protein IIT72_07075, partial [Lachnospiraceae bacterium]|nr:hypothetical protein [Lachnospiraceae bacterium]
MKQRIIKKFFTAMLAATLVVTSAGPAGVLFRTSSVMAQAQSNVLSVSYDVTVDNTKNEAMVFAENANRRNADPNLADFAHDSSLDKIATERAKDIALFYSHLRPDNT